MSPQNFGRTCPFNETRDPSRPPVCGVVRASRRTARSERLGAVGNGVAGVGMDLDDQAVAPGGQRGERHRRHVLAMCRCRGWDRRSTGRWQNSLHRRDHRRGRACSGCGRRRSARRARRGRPGSCRRPSGTRPPSATRRAWPTCPRFSSTGLRHCPTRFSSEKFCMLRVPIWSMSAACFHRRGLLGVHHLGDDAHAQLRSRRAAAVRAPRAPCPESCRGWSAA